MKLQFRKANLHSKLESKLKSQYSIDFSLYYHLYSVTRSKAALLRNFKIRDCHVAIERSIPLDALNWLMKTGPTTTSMQHAISKLAAPGSSTAAEVDLLQLRKLSIQKLVVVLLVVSHRKLSNDVELLVAHVFSRSMVKSPMLVLTPTTIHSTHLKSRKISHLRSVDDADRSMVSRLCQPFRNIQHMPMLSNRHYHFIRWHQF